MWFVLNNVPPHFNLSVIAFLGDKNLEKDFLFVEGQMNDAQDFMRNSLVFKYWGHLKYCIV